METVKNHPTKTSNATFWDGERPGARFEGEKVVIFNPVEPPKKITLAESALAQVPTEEDCKEPRVASGSANHEDVDMCEMEALGEVASLVTSALPRHQVMLAPQPLRPESQARSRHQPPACPPRPTRRTHPPQASSHSNWLYTRASRSTSSSDRRLWRP